MFPLYHWSRLQNWINGNEDEEKHIFLAFLALWFQLFVYNSVTNIEVHIVDSLGEGQFILSMEENKDGV